MKKTNDLYKQAKIAADFLLIKSKGIKPKVVIILGSGLSDAASLISEQVKIPIDKVPYFIAPSIHTHLGNIIIGEMADCPVSCFQGRIHEYEGCTQQQIIFPVLVAHLMGARVSILTNLAGGINEDHKIQVKRTARCIPHLWCFMG